MNAIMVVAIGGAVGAVLRYLMSSSIYQWLGRGFPYGTLAVNLLGCFLMGLMTQTLLLQRVALAQEYRLAILVGLFGGLTTFSTFAIETLGLLESGDWSKAANNVLVSVMGCLFAVWLGHLLGKGLLHHGNGILQWQDGWIPYALLVANAIGAFLIGLIATMLMHKLDIELEYRVIMVALLIGSFVTLSSLYLILNLLENKPVLFSLMAEIVGVLCGNVAICALALIFGFWVAKQV